MAYTTLTGDYGYKEYWVRDASGTTINATNADWHIAATETVPAINIYDSSGTVIDGGEIWGEISQTAEWASIYNHMATGFRVSNSPNTTIRNVHIDGTWDGIRFVPDDSLNVANGNSNGWLVEDVYMHNIRDDAIENDFAATGTLRDSLLDGVFSGFGTVNDQSAHGVLTVDDSIIIMKDYLHEGQMTHGSPFKFNTDNPENNPDLKIVNTIIAVQDPDHNGLARMKEAWANLTESSGNYFLNLSDTPFPSWYPLPPKGFTILQGKAARDFLAAEKAKWLAEHGDAQAPTEPPAQGDASNDFNGDGRSDILWRHDDGRVTDWLGTGTGAFVDNAANAMNWVPKQWDVIDFGDFNGDGRDDILWRNENGLITDWLGKSNGGFADNYANSATQVSTDWQIDGIGDFNGDGRDDILWRNEKGVITDWLGKTNGGFAANYGNSAAPVPTDWQVAGIGDFNGDGRDDILWRNGNGLITDWLGKTNGGFADNYSNSAAKVPTSWQVAGIGDFNGDGRDDILWRNDAGVITDWLGKANGGFADNGANAWSAVPTSWDVAGIGDFNGDGRDDILWRDQAGTITDWLGKTNGGFAVNAANFYGGIPTDWQVEAFDIQLV